MTRATSIHNSRRLARILCAALLAAGVSAGAAAQTLTTLYSFPASATDGQTPINSGALLADAAGALYGTTFAGGIGADCCGTVFKLTPSATTPWPETVLYRFTGSSDGANPVSGLISDSSGALYGTTILGGGPGNVFKLTPSGGGYTESVLHNFHISGGDGGLPFAPLIADSAGALYGTASQGGQFGGVVFKLTPVGGGSYAESVLHNFLGGADGQQPMGGLLADSSGALYGTTAGDQGFSTNGTVYKLTPNGDGSYTESVLYAFAGGSDGAAPFSGLIADSSGALYGTTLGDGGVGTSGTVFKLTPSGGGYTESVLHNFTGGSDGGGPVAGLLADATGALYGTTSSGGANGQGTVFKLTPARTAPWPLTVLWNFTGGADGSAPQTGLISDQSGNLYGAASFGGSNGAGTVFKLAGTGFVPPTLFAGIPGTANCIGKSVSDLAKTYGGIAHAAQALGYPSVSSLQNAVFGFCGG